MGTLECCIVKQKHSCTFSPARCVRKGSLICVLLSLRSLKYSPLSFLFSHKKISSARGKNAHYENQPPSRSFFPTEHFHFIHDTKSTSQWERWKSKLFGYRMSLCWKELLESNCNQGFDKWSLSLSWANWVLWVRYASSNQLCFLIRYLQLHFIYIVIFYVFIYDYIQYI